MMFDSSDIRICEMLTSIHHLDVHPLCTVEFDLEASKLLENSIAKTSTSDNAVYRYYLFGIALELGGTNLTFSIKFGGETVAIGRAKYKEDFGED